MQHPSAADNQPGGHLEMSLREHLLAAGASGSGPAPYPSASGPPPPSDHQYPATGPESPHDQFDQGQPPYMGEENPGDEGPTADARKGKRELSTSKRAAQNRAAQRAFRQRKEGYIKKLEEHVKEFDTMAESVRNLQAENYQLREYILSLQSRLLETQSDVPPAPTQTNLATLGSDRGERSAIEQQLRREMDHPHSAPLRHDAMSQLQAAAAQASDGITSELGGKRTRADDLGDEAA